MLLDAPLASASSPLPALRGREGPGPLAASPCRLKIGVGGVGSRLSARESRSAVVVRLKRLRQTPGRQGAKITAPSLPALALA